MGACCSRRAAPAAAARAPPGVEPADELLIVQPLTPYFDAVSGRYLLPDRRAVRRTESFDNVG